MISHRHKHIPFPQIVHPEFTACHCSALLLLTEILVCTRHTRGRGIVARRYLNRYRLLSVAFLSITGLVLVAAAFLYLDRSSLLGSSIVPSPKQYQFSYYKGSFEDPLPRTTCFELAKSLSQPYVVEYNRTKMEVLEGPGDVPPAYYRWEGLISREEFDRVKDDDNTYVFFQFVGGKLYVKKSGIGWDRLKQRPHLKFRYDTMVDMLLLTGHYYRIKDVDFIVQFEDILYCNIPALGYSVQPQCTKGGFAVPSYTAFADSLGQEQISTLYRCFDKYYPKASRQLRVVWRGSTTGSAREALLTKDNYLQNTRVRLALLGRFYNDIMDVGISDYVQLEEGDAEVLELLEESVPRVPRIDIEEFNRYAIIVDLDGNAWSDRFARLAFFNTPLLKQNSTRFKEFFGHLLENNTHVISFSDDLSGFTSLTATVLKDYRRNPRKYKQIVRNMQEFARRHLSHLGVIHAAAYALRIMSDKLTWTPRLEDGYDHLPARHCCRTISTLPHEVTDSISMSLD